MADKTQYDIQKETHYNNNLCDALAEYGRISRQYAQLNIFQEDTPDAGADDIRVIELFAGVGGFRVGLERASSRFVTVWNNQWEPSTKRQDASQIYCNRFGYSGHSNEDISKVPTDEIPAAELLVGGFPCQDYSVATTLKNSHGIAGKKGVLWWEIHRILKESMQPIPYLMLENVDRLLKSPARQRGRDFALILASLSDLGYVVEWRVINAADYGMPQRRRRTYMVAYHRGFNPIGEAFERCDDKFHWILTEGVEAKAFACEEKSVKKRGEFDINGDLVKITDEFNNNPKSQSTSPFGSAGVMDNRHVWTTDVEPDYNGPRISLGDILLDEDEVDESFFINDDEIKRWEYLKGGKKEKRLTKDGFEYDYSEGPMAFPDKLDVASRTIITGEGGKGPSRFKHVVLTPNGRFRRLTPIELERLNMFPDNHTEGASDVRRAFLMGNSLVTGIVEKLGCSLLSMIMQ